MNTSTIRHSTILGISSAACVWLAIGIAHAAVPDGRLFQPSRAWLENYVSTQAPTVRYGLGVETASDPLLSDNAFTTLGINVEYNFTPLGDEANDVSALELKFPVVFEINESWSAFLIYNPRWDLLSESDRHRLELSTTHIRGADHQYAWSHGGELPLTSENFEFKLATSFSWYF